MIEPSKNSKRIKNYDLFLLYHETKDIEIRNQIFEKYKYMAEIISRKYSNRGIEHDDIYQIACMGLIFAIERFDISKGFEFTSFATPTILGEIKKYFRDKGWAVKVPRKIQEISRKVNEYNNILTARLHRAPTIKEIAEYISSTEEEVLEAFEAGRMFNSQSLDEKFDLSRDDNDISLMDVVGAEDKHYNLIENLDFLNKSMSKLNELEKNIIIKRFYENKTQSDIAKELKISQMTVSRIEKKSLEKLRIEYYR
ncbi:MAG TPA: SigB/SigF/SigG family RNA polymerase sigma factor [Sedimentibacter sp.]|jgi:RNA polymerase sigma-B factor|nr:SigB/SigF/SigG family RNA polymerase sigma factor [Sedimentibacter sp.]NLA12829.1 SigB/SigF/SigG family RNA polymerase sigma factor [Tissierellia bacterium]HAS91746.1 B/F/G family RNA polymerase sigma-70 factor [Clostridiales bacterium]HOA19096.1 SigB/SigF/SigG family RNA polymerase sigma factor [Sedimentibacter sp.]HOG62242.1 SigB/SigF/SigG family RNA polymerase sigma factor [Sedimentibacter sp.]